MSVKFATRAEGECCNHTNWQSLVPHEWNKLFFNTSSNNKLYVHRQFWNEKIAIFPIRGESSNSCEIRHFPVSTQTVKVQFSLDALRKCFTRVIYDFFSTWGSKNGFVCLEGGKSVLFYPLEAKHHFLCEKFIT